MGNLERLVLVLENCEDISIPASSIGYFNINGIHSPNVVYEDGKLDELEGRVHYTNNFSVGFYNKGVETSYENMFGVSQDVVDILTNRRDVTQIEVHTKDKEVRTYWVNTKVDEANKNVYQTCKVGKDNFIKLSIRKPVKVKNK